jgi:hypothetical protein
MLTTTDLPVISHVSEASVDKPLLKLMLTLDSRLIMQTASEMQLPPLPRQPMRHPITIEALDERLIADLIRLVELLDQPALALNLAPLIKQEIVLRLLAGPQLQRLAEPADRQSSGLAQTALLETVAGRRSCDPGSHEPIHVPPALCEYARLFGTPPLQDVRRLRVT